MLILPDRNISRPKILLPVSSAQWREPSQAQPKDYFGRSNQTRFRIRARLNDGHVVWCGWFDDREDLDYFLWAIASGRLHNDAYVQRLPTPWWPGLDPLIGYDFATVTFLTSPTGSNQTFTSPGDWDNAANSVEALGSAGGGAATVGTVHATGGGAAAYAKITNFSFASPGSTTATYNIGAVAAAVSSSSGSVAGNSGASTWFNNASDPGGGTDNSKCSAAGGVGGTGAATGSAINGGASGADTSSWGTTRFSGGRGGNLTGTAGAATGASGGGGAAGVAGAGGNGVDSAAATGNIVTAGGTADNGTIAGGTTGTTTGNPGNSGTEWNGSHGSGSGGASGSATVGPTFGGNGASYGGAGAAARNGAGSTATAGSGAQGLIVITYTPLAARPFTGGVFDTPRSTPRTSYSFLSGINLDLIGQDAMAPGAQSTELPKANPPTSWSPASYQQPTNLSLLGPVVFPAGKALYELPERHRYPPTSYPTAWAWSYNLNLIGQDQLPAGQASYETPRGYPLTSWIRTWTHFEPLTITGVLPIGASSYETPQRFPATSWPTSWTWSYNLNLIGKDILPAGRQLTEPMRGYFYAPDLRTTALNLSLLLQRPPIAQYDWPLPIPPYRMPQSWITPSAPFWLNKPFLQTDWPLPIAPWRSPSLSTWVDPLKLNLIGQDAMAPGQQATELARGVPLTSWIRTWVWYSLPIAPLNQFPLNQYDWPLPVPQRPGIQLRTWTNSYLLTLIGQDRMAAGAQIYDLARGAPPPVPSWVNPSAPFWLNKPFLQTDWPLPVPQWRMPQSWAASYNLNLIGQDQLPFRQTDWPLPGRQPLFLAAPYLFPIGLAPAPVQPFAQYDWPLPTRPPYFNAAPTLVPPSLLILSARPFAQYDWPVPFRDSLFRQASIASSPFFLVKPFAQYDWPVPIARSAFRPSSAMSAAITFLTVRPFAQTDWPLPQSPQYPASLRTATGDNAVQLQLITMPQGKASYDLTGRPPHPISLRGYTLSLGPPAFRASVPFRQTDWPLPTPQRPSIQLRTWIDPVKLNLLGKDTRFFVYDRPLPRRQPDPPFSYAYSRFPGLIPTSFAVCAHSEVTAFESTTRVSSATSQTEVVSPLTSNTKFASC